MLSEILAWWRQQMADMLPSSLRAGADYRDALVVRMAGAQLVASLRRRGEETLLGPVEPGLIQRSRSRHTVVVALPPATLLQQTATLPLAAERDLQAVLGHEMDRLTPFAAADLYWSWRVESRDRAAGRLMLRLLLVPKLAVAASLEALQHLGLRPIAIEVPDGKTVAHLPLQHDGTASRNRRSATLAAWACAALAMALVVVPVVRQQFGIAATQARIEALRPQVALVEALRRRVADNDSGANLFLAELARVGSPLRAIAALTAAMPDDTYLTNLTMRERKLSVSGRSAAAAKLIGTLSANPDLRDPAFDAPVTRVGDRSDLFSIRATLAP